MKKIKTPYGSFQLDVEPSPQDKRDFLAEQPYEEIELPEAVDHRENLPPIRNQGSQGSCSAQTAASMKEWQEFKESGFKGHMSPQFVYNNRANQDTPGMFPRDTMKILKKIGCCSEKVYPYGEVEAPDKIDREAYDEAFQYRIKGYGAIFTKIGLQKALFKNGPCYISVPVYNYSGQIWKKVTNQKLRGYHAMTAVGYNKEGFIIRNSWGTKFGDKGYTLFPYSDWGLQCEVWTTIDMIMTNGSGAPENKVWEWFKDYWISLALGGAILIGGVVAAIYVL